MKILYPNLYIEKQVKLLEDVRGIKVGFFYKSVPAIGFPGYQRRENPIGVLKNGKGLPFRSRIYKLKESMNIHGLNLFNPKPNLNYEN
jgi:hypothetical protein